MDECESPVVMVGNGVVEPPGFEVTLLEPRPFRPFKSSEEYLYAMKEDLAEWLNGLYEGLDLDADNFLEQMETGVILCQHANNVVRKAREYYRSGNAMHGDVPIPDRDVVYRYDVLPETFHARDNVSNFISWCRSLNIKECLLFETDDLVLRKNERSFILCLLEVARRGVKFGMPAPLLVQLEQEIDAEIANDDDGYETLCVRQPQVVTNDLRSLHERVVELLSRCTCPSQFPMIRVADGKYRIGDTKVLIFVRILRSHVMVRVGGGWDTLAHYLDKHDPCRCRSGHRLATSAKLTMLQGKSSIPSMHVTYNRPPQAPSSTPSSPQNHRRSQSHSSPTAHRRGLQQNSSPPSSTIRPHSSAAPCSDDSSTSSLQDSLERKAEPPERRHAANNNSSTEDEDEEDSPFKRCSPRRRMVSSGRRDLVLRDTVPSSWKYSPGIPRKEYYHSQASSAANGHHVRKPGGDGQLNGSGSRLPALTPRCENRQPPKVGKVSPRVQPRQTWSDHRSHSSEDVYQEGPATSPVGQQQQPPPRTAFHPRGPSPVHHYHPRTRSERLLVAEGGFRRNDPKRHSSPRINSRPETRMRLSPPKPPAKRTVVTNGGGGAPPPTPTRRMFWSPERQHRVPVTRKNSAPGPEGNQSPVIEKLIQNSDLCSDRNFLMKIEQLIEEFQAKTMDEQDFAYSSLPDTLKEEDPVHQHHLHMRRSPVEGKSPSKIPLPTWYPKCPS